jgi:hypothetical protein
VPRGLFHRNLSNRFPPQDLPCCEPWDRSGHSGKGPRRDFDVGSIVVYGILAVLNLGTWLAIGIASVRYPILLGLGLTAYGLGLRHAVDPDHIAAIDNTTRKLMQDGKRPVAVGFFFSLGHSTVVLLLSVLVAVAAAFVKTNLPTLQSVGRRDRNVGVRAFPVDRCSDQYRRLT